MSTTELAPAESEVAAEDVRQHLQRVLASQRFRTSRRLSSFLSYTVEHALANDTAHIKERTLGIEVFARRLDYNTNEDPIVRVTAATVRQRLGLFYQENQEDRVQIVFRKGSYVPVFIANAPLPVTDTPEIPSSEFAESTEPAYAPAEPPVLPVHSNQEAHARRWSATHLSLLVGASLALLLLAGFAWFLHRPAPMEAFWAPIVRGNRPVWLCLPDFAPPASTAAPLDTPSNYIDWSIASGDHVSFADASVLMSVTHVLGRADAGYRLYRANEIRLDDLRQGPGVLVGSLHNAWTERLSSNLRFQIARDGDTRYVLDREQPSVKKWSNADKVSAYGVISRFDSPLIGQPVVLASGTLRFGTSAAARCLADKRCFTSAYSLSPGDWSKGTVQIVVKSTMVNGIPSEPQVIAVSRTL